MGTLVLGVASGFLMASVFVCAGVMMLFATVRDTPPAFQPVQKRIPPSNLAMATVILGFPTWGIIGAAMGLLYEISAEQAPGAGLGSPNQVYTLAVVIVAVLMAAPFLVLLRHVLAGVLVIAVTFIGVFGWFLPLFVG